MIPSPPAAAADPPLSGPPARATDVEPPPPVLEHRDRGFDELCRRHHAPVAALAYVLTGDWGVAEDLAQEAFLAAFRRWDVIGGYDNPGAWVRRVVANRSVSHRRRRGSERRALARVAGRPTVDAEPPATLDEDLWAALRALPARQAQVFALTYVEDLSTAQVADVLGIAPGTTKSHLHRARATLGELLADRRPGADHHDQDHDRREDDHG